MAQAVGRILEFIEAVKSKSLEEIRALWDSFTSVDKTKCLSDVDGNGYTAFLIAAGTGKVEILRLLWETCKDKQHTL